MYGNVHTIPIEQFDQAPSRPAVPPTLWQAAEDDDLPPLLARRRGVGYEIVEGPEIWQAAQLAQCHTVPAVLTETPSRPGPRAVRSAYLKDPITEATALEILKETHHMTDAALADRLGWTRKQVADYRRLLRLDPEVQEHVRAGRLSVAKAAELVSIPPNRQRQIAERAVNLQLSLVDIRGLARRWKEPRKPDPVLTHADPPPQEIAATTEYATDPDIARLEKTLEEAIGCRARIDMNYHRLILDCSTMEVLEGLIERFLGGGHR